MIIEKNAYAARACRLVAESSAALKDSPLESAVFMEKVIIHQLT
jgi:hypothetical protein